MERDPNATGQALAVVLLSSVAAGIGAAQAGIGQIVLMLVAALLGWVVWAAIIYLVGAKLLPEPQTSSDIGELLRCIGFASAPGVLRILGFIPILGAIISLVVFIWMIATMVVAVRQALDYTSTGRAVGVVVIGFIAYLAITLVFGLLFGGMAMLAA